MQITGMILGCLLLGQGSDAALASQSGRSRPLPPQMVADAMTLPSGSTLAGQPMTLLGALGSTPDRRQQLELTRAYWRLVQAVAEYHFSLDYVQELGRIKPTDSEPASLRLARTSAGAMLRQAELEATQAQCELAGLVRLPADSPLPLPADRPHVGPYATKFREMFAGRTAPEPAALMERILPIRRQAVDEQAAAVQAAEDVLAAAADPQQGGRADATAVIESGRELLRQRRAFIHSVCEYNRNIAEYGLAVASAGSTPQALVAILIGPAQQGTPPAVAGDGRSVQPAGAIEPMPTPSGRNWRIPEPTPAPPSDAVKKNEPTLAPPRDGLRPVGRDEPKLTPPRDEADKAPAEDEPKPLAPVEPLPSSSPQPRTANKPATAAAASPLYPALVEMAPAARAKQLTAALHWDRSLPEGIGKPMSLADCLMRQPGGNRLPTIESYWRLRQRAAEYQVLAQQAELLDGLVPVALARRNEPSGAAEMLRVRAAQLAAQAAVREAHAALVEAQYALALQVGATGEAAWPLAATVPHSGRYLLKLDAQPRGLVQTWPVRRLAATIPGLGEGVQQHAAAVVEADTARASAAEHYRNGGVPVDQAIACIAAQTEQTLALLDTLTDYNRAIAEYALIVMPPATPADRLAAALVVKPNL